MVLTNDMTTDGLPDYCRVIRINGPNGQVKEMIFPRALDLDRPKRPRTTFSGEQLATLETEFQTNQYLVGTERKRLAKQLALTETQIKVWFQNRRTKTKHSREKDTVGADASNDVGCRSSSLSSDQSATSVVTGTDQSPSSAAAADQSTAALFPPYFLSAPPSYLAPFLAYNNNSGGNRGGHCYPYHFGKLPTAAGHFADMQTAWNATPPPPSHHAMLAARGE